MAGDFLEIRLDGVDVECPPPLPVRSPHLQLSESNLSAVPAEEVLLHDRWADIELCDLLVNY